jgi:TRAP-type C4-dicarboxylate transport system substrate-binding protein
MATSSGTYAASKINLKMSNYFPSVIPQSTILQEFADDVTQMTNGQVQIRYFPGGSLLKAPATIKGVESGIADIGLAHIEYTAGRFPVMEACEMPLGYSSGYVANQIMNDFYNKFQPKEFDKFKVLWMHANAPSLLLTKEPIRTLDDLKGKIIRAPGRFGDVIKALGGTPAPTPIMETYDAISKGVVDGVFVPYETLKGFKFGEVVKYVTDTSFLGPTYPFYVVMNKRSFDRLPQNVKDVFEYLRGVYRERMALMWNGVEFPGRDFGKEKGVEVIRLSATETAKWKKAVAPVIEEYKKDMKSKGFKDAEIKSWFDYIEQRIEFWNKKQAFYRIETP